MKIYRTALNERIVTQVVDNAGERPFSKLFGKRSRILLPLKNNTILVIIKKLEEGETNTGTSYRVDLDNKVAYRYIIVDKEKKLDPRPMRLGKVIFKELEKEDVDQWSIQQNSIQDANYSIIISRDPIDVVRMSDHGDIESCHSPDGDYFSSAMQEAIDGGAIAYLVKNEDIRDLDEKKLQEKNIFRDRDRRIKGIEPISRIRINKYYEEDDSSDQIAIPINRLYGVNHVAGFFDTVKQYLYSEQEKYINYDKLNLKNYNRAGGDYAHVRDNKIAIDFFGNDMGITRDLEHKSTENMVDIYNEELAGIVSIINNKLIHSSVGSTADISDEYIYFSNWADIKFEIQGIESDKNIDRTVYRSLIDLLKLPYFCQINEVEFEQEDDKVNISFSMYLEGENIHNPDDVENMLEDIVRWEKNYTEALKNLRIFLIREGYIYDNKFEENQKYFEYYYDRYIGENNKEIVKDDQIIEITIPVNFIKESIDSINMKNNIAGLFKNLIKSQFEIYYKNEINQEKFEFYNSGNDQELLEKLIRSIPEINIEVIQLAGGMDYRGWGVLPAKKEIIITIGNEDILENGVNFIKSFLMALRDSYQKFMYNLYSIYGHKVNTQNIRNVKIDIPKDQEAVGTIETVEDNNEEDNEEKKVIANSNNWYKIAKINNKSS